MLHAHVHVWRLSPFHPVSTSPGSRHGCCRRDRCACTHGTQDLHDLILVFTARPHVSVVVVVVVVRAWKWKWRWALSSPPPPGFAQLCLAFLCGCNHNDVHLLTRSSPHVHLDHQKG